MRNIFSGGNGERLQFVGADRRRGGHKFKGESKALAGKAAATKTRPVILGDEEPSTIAGHRVLCAYKSEKHFDAWHYLSSQRLRIGW
jgi:hypothetical protein